MCSGMMSSQKISYITVMIRFPQSRLQNYDVPCEGERDIFAGKWDKRQASVFYAAQLSLWITHDVRHKMPQFFEKN